jgi:hypothetical protein
LAKSRYSNVPIIDGNHYATWRLPVKSAGYKTIDLLEGVQTIPYTWKIGDRFDKLAAIYYNDDEYYWVIALVNNKFWAWGVNPGDVIQIPVDVRDILRKLQ